jgi:hypothetical protein
LGALQKQEKSLETLNFSFEDDDDVQMVYIYTEQNVDLLPVHAPSPDIRPSNMRE